MKKQAFDMFYRVSRDTSTFFLVIGNFEALCGLDGSREASSDIFYRNFGLLIRKYSAVCEILQDIWPRSVDV